MPGLMLASLIIGAGMFSLPYVFALSGTVAGIFYLVVCAALAGTIHLMYGRVVKESPGKWFAGHAEEFLGKRMKTAALLINGVGTAVTLTIYLVISYSFASLILPGISENTVMFFFWAIGSLAIALGVKKISGTDELMTAIMAVIIIGIAIYGIFYGDTAFVFKNFGGFGNILLPFGPALFAMSGRAGIASIFKTMSSGEEKESNFKKAVIFGTVLPAVLYTLFVAGIFMLSSSGVAKDAVSGLYTLPQPAIVLLGLLGMLAIITSYIFIGIEFKGILKTDLKLPGYLALIIVVGVAPFLIFCGLSDLVKLIAAAGGIFISAESILVVFMWQKIVGKRPLWSYLPIIAFTLAAVYGIVALVLN